MFVGHFLSFLSIYSTNIYLDSSFIQQIHPNHRFSFLYSFQPHPPPLFLYPHPLFSLHKREGLQEITPKQGKRKYDKTRQKHSYLIWTRQCNMRKESQEQAKDLKTYPIRSSNKHQSNSHNK